MYVLKFYVISKQKPLRKHNKMKLLLKFVCMEIIFHWIHVGKLVGRTFDLNIISID